MFSPGIPYNTSTGNIQTINGDTIQITHELIVDEIPIDVGNTDVVTLDAFNRLHKLPIASLPVGDSFDQSLNTTDEVVFERVCIKENFLDSTVDSDICIFSPNIASCTWDTSASLYPSFSITDRSSLNVSDGTSFCWGYYRNKNTGFAMASETQWVSMARGHNSQNLLISGSSTPQSIGGLVTSEMQIMDISVNEVIIQTPIKLMGVPFQTIQIAQNILTLNNENTVEKSSVLLDTFGNYTSSGFITVETPILAPELISSFVLIKEGASNLIKKVSLDDLYGQGLNSLSDVEFNSINLGSIPSTDTRSQIKISGPVGPLVPVYPGNQNLGGRIEIFNDSNPLPLATISAYNDLDQALAFGCYGSTDAPWIKSSETFFKFQKIDAVFGLYTNLTSGIIGSDAIDKPIVIYKNIGLNAVIEYHQPVKLLNTTVDPENADTYFLTVHKSTNEILKRDFSPAYGTISGQGNIIETVITTVDIYVPLFGFNAGVDPLRNITNNVNSLQITNSGLYEIQYNISIEPAALASTKLWEVSVFVNGVSNISSSQMCCQTTDSDELTEISNSCMYDGNSNDIFDLRIRNRTNTVNVIMRCATMTIKRLIN